MKKDTYYFSHDYNSSNDVKVLFLRQQLGMEGYGIFWYLVEQLAQSGGTLPLRISPVLAMQMQVPEIKVRAVIEQFDLFVIKNDAFESERLNEHLQIRKNLSKSAIEGNKKRWGERSKDSTFIATLSPPDSPCERNLNPKESKVKEIKVKESKEKYADFIESVCLITGKSYRGDKKSEGAFNARIKEGYQTEDILEALENAIKQENHIKNSFRYLTPEFITRQDKIELYKNK